VDDGDCIRDSDFRIEQPQDLPLMHADQYKGLPPIVPLSGGKPFAFVVFSKLALSLYISGSVRSCFQSVFIHVDPR
jgi:hypothetical protein